MHALELFFFILMLRPPPTSTLFPYTTLFRSTGRATRQYGQYQSRAALRHRGIAVARPAPAGAAAREAGAVRARDVVGTSLTIAKSRTRARTSSIDPQRGTRHRASSRRDQAVVLGEGLARSDQAAAETDQTRL